VVHVALGRRSSPVFAPPRMEHVREPILDARKVRGASAEGFWQQAFALLFLMTQPGAAAAGAAGDVDFNLDSLKEMLENIRNGLQRDGLLAGFEPRTVAPALADPTPQLDAAIKAVSIGIDCPKRVLEGSEVGVLASDQDTRDWLASIRLRNSDELTPGLVGPVVSRLVTLGVVPKPGKGFKADWDDVSTQTDQEKATVFLTRVQAYAAYVAGNVEALFPPLDAMTRLDSMTRDEAGAVIDAATSAQDETLTVPPAGGPGHPATPPAPPKPPAVARPGGPKQPAADDAPAANANPEGCNQHTGPGCGGAAGALHEHMAREGGPHTLTSLGKALGKRPGKLAPALDELLQGGHVEEAGAVGGETAYRVKAQSAPIPHTAEAVGKAATAAAAALPGEAHAPGDDVKKVFVSDAHAALAARLGGMTLGQFKGHLDEARKGGHAEMARADLTHLYDPAKVAASATPHYYGGTKVGESHFVVARRGVHYAANYDPGRPRVPAGPPGGGGVAGAPHDAAKATPGGAAP
jgi:hypothetical protein